MDSCDILAGEHRLLARVLDALEVVVERARSSGRVELPAGRAVLDFCRTSADGLHQDKEERALFPQLLGRLGRLQVPEVERLSARHERDRALLVRVRSQLVCAAAGEPVSLAVFMALASDYVNFQRRHMLEENRGLLPLARRVLTPDDDGIVRAGFRRLEHEYGIEYEPAARQLLADLELELGELPASPFSRRLAQGVSGA